MMPTVNMLRILVSILFSICMLHKASCVVPQIKTLNVQCDRTGMKVIVDFDIPFNGIIFSKGHYSDFGCRFVRENSGQKHYEFGIPIDKCGTNNMEIGGGEEGSPKKGFENIVVFQNNPIYQEEWDHARMIVCRFSLEDDQDVKDKRVVFKPLVVDMLDVISIPVSDSLTGIQTKVDCWMEITSGRFPNIAPIDGPVKVGNPLTLAIFIRDPRKRTDIHVKECFAYDDPTVAEKDGPPLLQLTDAQGCPIHNKLITVWKRTQDTGNTGATMIAFTTVSAFKFPDRADLQIACNVELCRDQCLNRCNRELPSPISVIWPKDGSIGSTPPSQKPDGEEGKDDDDEKDEKDEEEKEEKDEEDKEEKDDEDKEEDKDEDKEEGKDEDKEEKDDEDKEEDKDEDKDEDKEEDKEKDKDEDKDEDKEEEKEEKDEDEEKEEKEEPEKEEKEDEEKEEKDDEEKEEKDDDEKSNDTDSDSESATEKAESKDEDEDEEEEEEAEEDDESAAKLKKINLKSKKEKEKADRKKLKTTTTTKAPLIRPIKRRQKGPRGRPISAALKAEPTTTKTTTTTTRKPTTVAIQKPGRLRNKLFTPKKRFQKEQTTTTTQAPTTSKRFTSAPRRARAPSAHDLSSVNRHYQRLDAVAKGPINSKRLNQQSKLMTSNNTLTSPNTFPTVTIITTTSSPAITPRRIRFGPKLPRYYVENVTQMPDLDIKEEVAKLGTAGRSESGLSVDHAFQSFYYEPLRLNRPTASSETLIRRSRSVSSYDTVSKNYIAKLNTGIKVF